MAALFELLRMEWLAEFYARYPNISIDFLLDDAATDLIAERIDLALRVGIETGSGFRVLRVAPNAMILAASPAYLERLRTLLIHGARSVLLHSKRRTDQATGWLADLVARRNPNIAAVALANKTARVVWALLAHDRRYQQEYAQVQAV